MCHACSIGRVVCVWVLGAAVCSVASGAISVSGDVTPADPAAWDSSVTVRIGPDRHTSGSVTIDGGSDAALHMFIAADELYTTASVRVSGPGTTLDCNDRIVVGGFGDAAMTISDGAVVTAPVTRIGDRWSSTSSLSVSGQGARLESSVEVGGSGGVDHSSEAALTVSGGAVVIGDYGEVMTLWPKSPENATATVTGPGSTWTMVGNLHIGQDGAGCMTIEAGGAVACLDGWLGANPDSYGRMAVSGADSTWTVNGSLWVGENGEGLLKIEHGASVAATDHTRVGQYLDWVDQRQYSTIEFDNGALTTGCLHAGSRQLIGTGTIYTGGVIADGIELLFDATHGLQQTWVLTDGPDKNITIHMDYDPAGDLGAGCSGPGTLTIRDGVTISSQRAMIGWYEDGDGTATVSGPGSTWNCTEDLDVGYYGRGELLITDGAAMNVAACARLGFHPDSIGTVTVTGAGSAMVVDEFLKVGREGSAELTIADGAVVTVSDHISIAGMAGSTGVLNVGGAGSKLLQTAGSFSVGNRGVGEVNIADRGLVALDHTAFNVPYLGDDDVINMASGGALALESRCDGSLAEFRGAINGNGAIRYWDDTAGDWADITGATEGVDYTLAYVAAGDLAGYTVLTVGATPRPGDADFDGDVDLADFVILKLNFGRTDATAAEGDFDGNGAVDLNDFVILKLNWGARR